MYAFKSSQALTEVAGARLLDYLLRVLNHKKISEIFIVTKDYKTELEEHIALYQKEKFPKKLQVIFSETLHSFGDCLRETLVNEVLQEDFILIRGGCLISLDLSKFIEAFEACPKNSIMLKAFNKGTAFNEARTPESNCFLMLNQENRIMTYENIREGLAFTIKGNSGADSLENPRVEFKDINQFTVRFDLYDTMVSICKQNVLNYYTENFDYHVSRR